MPPKSSKGQPKLNIEKSAWKWAETTDPANITKENLHSAYRLNLRRCDHFGQRRNCKGNPLCLIGLGEKEWLGEIADENWHDIEDPEDERRKKNLFVGLKNLGATCYVNSLLQVWFHNPIFRAAIYKYEERPFASESEDSEPQTICGHLQLIFALLEKSVRRFIDPTPFVNKLGLDTMQQQDAQEFSKLFISLLEDTLSTQRNPFVRNVVQELFSGEYAYVTRCTKCGHVSKRPSRFYELDVNIKGHKDLHQCLEEFLKEEKLEGDNQYMCHVCNSKQNARRKIALTQLPRVLNLQLLRFVFDRNTGHKKKLNTCLQFPEEIDMSQYLDQDIENTGPYKYELKAVLIHRGPTAYSGHYIAHIKDKKNGAWYKFNDEEVEKMKGSNLQLGNEEEIEVNQENAAKQGKKPRLSKGTHASKNAYMLVYYKKSEEQEQLPEEIDSEISLSVQELVDKDNERFEDWCKEMMEMRDKNIATGKAKQEEMKNMYQMIQLTEDCENEWLTTAWLSKWLTDSENTPKIDNTKLLCSHKKLLPDNVTKAKCVRSAGADLLYTKYDGGPRFTSDMLCMDCVRERCRCIRLKAKMADDSVFIAAALKNFKPEGTCYWVGKDSLRSWKKMALEQLNEDESGSNGDSEMDPEVPDSTTKDSSKVSAEISGSVAEHSLLTSSLACEADNARSEGKIYGHIAVPLADSGVAELMRLPGVKEESMSCGDTSSGAKISEERTTDLKKCDDVDKKTTDSTKLEVSGKKTQNCQDNGSNSPGANGKEGEPGESFAFNEDILCEEHGKLCTDVSDRRLVSEEVWTRLKAYFPDCPEYMEGSPTCEDCTMKAIEEARAKEDNKVIALEQKQYLSDLYFGKGRPKLSLAETELYVVNNIFLEAWRKFIRNPGRGDRPSFLNNGILLCHHDKLTFQPEVMNACDPSDENGVTLLRPDEWDIFERYIAVDTIITVLRIMQEDGSTTLVTSPEECDECIAMRLSVETFEKMDYQNAKIYVQKLSPGTDFTTAENCMGGNASQGSDKEDPEFSTTGKKKRKRPSGENDPDPGPEEVIPPKVTKPANIQIRRSSRHRKVRGEKVVTVDSCHTLRDLKLQLMKLFSVAPFDQHLMLDGKKLTDQNATLGSLGVQPECVLLLKVDEPMDGAYLIEDIPSSAPEEGFKGTGLLAGR